MQDLDFICIINFLLISDGGYGFGGEAKASI